ncbi:uncharacterized protein LOC129329840 [Eublepharis macularius]|uniref:ribonuclease H n=1 Tax=Eublepharis macularius TaxID=481883 RepID=A0AA97JBP1_EUBMA|nr:uncharacterized protein LOC129329840 [Eublepharis macularius]XP_054835525.1 uncharacterized protein LOC129329840 [Eublepharis macularius]XP_054835533.1 uncharacterized protein LOC129329840 [Eublepharis macularius]
MPAEGPTPAWLAPAVQLPPSPFEAAGPPTTAHAGREGRVPQLPSLPAAGTSHFCGLGGLARTPIRLHALTPLLARYPDRQAARFLREGFSSGFRIPFTGPRVAATSSNLRSARELPEVLAAKINKEVAAGRVAGPFNSPPLPNLRVSPLGVVPKKTPGEFRLIHHLSYPRGSSVNEAIPPELCSVRYASFDHAVRLVRACGRGALMAKCDIQSAFRLLPIHPSDQCLLGFKFRDRWYVDKAMPMGCSVACAAFETFSTFLEWVAKDRMGAPFVSHYLDDFIIMAPPNSPACADRLRIFQELAAELGVPLAEEKTEGPSPRLTYLGIELDSVAGLSRLPADKLARLRDLLTGTLARKKCTLRELQSIIGHLNFACRVVSPGRAFCARLTRACRGVISPHHHIRLTKGIKADLEVWLRFLSGFNGVALWQAPLDLGTALQVHSDAAGSLGFGVFFRGWWCAQPWPPSWASAGVLRDLTFLEFFPILVAVSIWGDLLRDKRVVFWCDNQATVRVINRQSSCSERVMRLVCRFVLTCLATNITFSARHVAGVDNGLADTLSRFQMERFFALAPEAQRIPDPFPEELWLAGGTS